MFWLFINIIVIIIISVCLAIVMLISTIPNLIFTTLVLVPYGAMPLGKG